MNQRDILIDIDHRQDIITLTLQQEQLIQQAVTACYELEDWPKDFEVSLSFVMNEEIQALNRDYRGKDQPTDVLSFPMDTPDNAPEKLLGDIVISVEKMLEQATEYGHSVDREMIYLVVHSTLHLMGYDHMTEKDKQMMREKEETIMKRLALIR
ncbi:rRNA maturation RNase YbeY [Anoxynatronum buryatiense]|uniref:Endoribonuclease YbeY n=1 Tax=Anoxynatronum buryatiense TaxID=489973 RepID=A0AA45WST9_9CLOT|nr:rRNA maturation RNase YbeY [Anoxynatronum buryatiense]SMP39477.1 probable rRNA maturation factor [Anoxynatronum buryatiense]